ncbi:HTTM domain-containing protein [Myxococcaceae bacterium JPH2]|nr:HTTM domain-containing protein [Myxococcaceae bacterium JPH2]
MTAALDTRGLGRKLAAFVTEPVAPHPLAFFRVGVALVLLAQGWMQADTLVSLFGDQGLLPWGLSEPLASPWVPRVGVLTHALQSVGVSPSQCVTGVLVVYGVALVGLLLGWRTRASAAVAWVVHAVLLNSGALFEHGLEVFAPLSLFYCALMPVGAALSLDKLAGRASSAPSAEATLSLRVLQLHLCLVYLSTGVEKALAPSWQDGTALWATWMQPPLARFDLAWLAFHPGLAKAATWGVLGIELGYAPCVWWKATRAPWVVLTLGMHLATGLVLGLWLPSLLLSVLTFAAFGYLPFTQALTARVQTRAMAAAYQRAP